MPTEKKKKARKMFLNFLKKLTFNKTIKIEIALKTKTPHEI